MADRTVDGIVPESQTDKAKCVRACAFSLHHSQLYIGRLFKIYRIRAETGSGSAFFLRLGKMFRGVGRQGRSKDETSFVLQDWL